MTVITEETKKLSQELLIIDGLLNAAFNETFFLQMRAGGYTAANVSIALPMFSTDRVRRALKEFAEWYELLDRTSHLVLPVRSAKDIERAKHEGKVGIIFGFQDAGPLGLDLYFARVFHTLGIRVMGLSYNRRNLVADGCAEESDSPLSRFGREVVKELNRLRIVIDLSHTGHRSAMEAVDISDVPVILSHSNAYAVCDHPRNAKDELIKAVAARGGVIGATALPMLLTRKAIKPKRTLADLLDHIDYLVGLVGEDHVGFGSDFWRFNLQDAIERDVASGFKGRLDHEPWSAAQEGDLDPDTLELVYPEGIRDVSQVPNLLQGLLNRGYSPVAAAKILGGNLFRVFREVWGS